jgi:uncharacterized protein YbjT (DUF2867 family)
MARILILGGTGRVALLLEGLLVAHGHTVTAVLHNPARESEVAATGASPVVVDMERIDAGQFENLVSGNDAVVWSAGAGGGDPARTYAVDRDAAIRAIDAASAVGVRRFIMMSWMGSRADHGVPEEHFRFPYAEAKWAADEHLRHSGLDWTILGPGALTFEEPTGRIQLDAEAGEASRADVAAVIAAALADDTTIGRTIRFTNGDVPIAEAISTRA